MCVCYVHVRAIRHTILGHEILPESRCFQRTAHVMGCVSSQWIRQQVSQSVCVLHHSFVLLLIFFNLFIHTHTHIHTYIHKHTYTHTRTHSLSLSLSLFCIHSFVDECCTKNTGAITRVWNSKVKADLTADELIHFKLTGGKFADHSLHTIWCEALTAMRVNDLFSQNTKEKLCFAGRFLHQYIFDFLWQFFENYDESVGKFAFAAFSEAHESAYRRVSTMDHDLKNFLLQMTSKHDDLVILVLGDHGVYVCMCMYVCVCVYMCVCESVCDLLRMQYMCGSTSIKTNTLVCVCVCVCVTESQ